MPDRAFTLTMNKLLFLTFLIAGALSTASAQKFGYCNSAAIMGEMPEVKQADSDLQAFQTQLTKRGQERVKALQDKAADLDRKKDQGTISPKELDEQTVKLQEEQTAIQKYQQEVYDELSKKRQVLYQPLIDKVTKAIQDVAKENGFMYLFDDSNSILLYKDESLDVTKLVKTKLGL